LALISLFRRILAILFACSRHQGVKLRLAAHFPPAAAVD